MVTEIIANGGRGCTPFGVHITLEVKGLVSLAEIDNQDISTLVCDFMICERCGEVDREHSRMVANSLCPACKKPAGVARLYYPINIRVLVDLVQQAYHSYAPVGPISGPQAPVVGTILYFCTLREALLNHFLLAFLRAEHVKASLIEKMLDDNKLASQKFTSLFSAVVGKSWSEAVGEASTHDATDYRPVSDLMKSAASIRNEFLHEGTGWSATRDVATECINSLPALFGLFVALHNIYVRPQLANGDF
jgi:hypothetical protein